MKKVLLLALFISLSVTTVKGQDIYNFVLENATRTVNTPSTNFTFTRIAQFKRTALIYLKSKAHETMSEVTTDFLDTQAYCMSEFITLFFDEILKDSKLSPEARKDKIYMFMDATVMNPLFNDPDRETTYAYIDDGNELTPFSLDTDWEKALAQAQVLLKEWK